MKNSIVLMYTPVYQTGNIEEFVTDRIFTSVDDCNRYILSLANHVHVRPKEMFIIHNPNKPVTFSSRHILAEKLTDLEGLTEIMELLIVQCVNKEELYMKFLSYMRSELAIQVPIDEHEIENFVKAGWKD